MSYEEDLNSSIDFLDSEEIPGSQSVVSQLSSQPSPVVTSLTNLLESSQTLSLPMNHLSKLFGEILQRKDKTRGR